MTGVNVLVIFYSRRGETERLALAAGVGAIQARANIRLRRLPDLADPQTIQADASWRENLERMNKDYIAPREVDTQWADALILAAPRDCFAETARYLDSARTPLSGKLCAAIGPCAEAAAGAGLLVVPPSTEDLKDPVCYGRRVTEEARAKKQTQA
jgi:NAD(P)H dehydrogenase (quinone)